MRTTVNDILTAYKAEIDKKPSPGDTPSSPELELRFKDINREAFEALFTAISQDPSFTDPVLECSVNAISANIYEQSKTDNTQYIRKMIFESGSIVSDTYAQKTRLMPPANVPGYVKYSVGLSRESGSGSFSASASALLRFKVRVSFIYNEEPAPKWRFDLTAVKQGKLSAYTPSLMRGTRQKLFGNITAKTFITNLDYDNVDQFEAEIEYIGKDLPTAEDLNVAKKMFTLINPKYVMDISYQEELYAVAKQISDDPERFKNPANRLRQLGNQVLSLSKNLYYSEIFPPVGYLVTDKADGYRCLVSINGPRCRLLQADSMLEFGQLADGSPDITIADAEYIKSTDDGQSSGPTLRIFDVMMIRGENISKLGLADRIKKLGEVADIVGGILSSHTTPPYKIIIAQYIQLDDLEDGFRKIAAAKRNYETDGLIISEPSAGYFATKNYKWKPYEKNTIDFLAMACPPKMIGLPPYEKVPKTQLYLLFVGISQTMRNNLGLGLIPQYSQMFDTPGEYMPIQFSPSANPIAFVYRHPEDELLDKKIIEMGRDAENSKWILHKIRDDRKMEKTYFGNDFRTAEMTYINYIDPFNLEDLWRPADSYFTKDAGNIYVAANKFRRFAISLLLKNNLAGAKRVVDTAAGRGADIGRYQEIGVQEILCMDIDAAAIAELIRRKYTLSLLKKRHIKSWIGGDDDVIATTGYDRIHGIEYDKLIAKDVKSTTIHTLVADLRKPFPELLASTYQFGAYPGVVDGVVCNFALHYLCDTTEHIKNYLAFVAKLLKVGGLFMFVVMDGAAVFNLLKDIPSGRRWESREGEVIKYAITKKYAGDKLAAVGQMISVLLPFSDESYDEPLCNVANVITEATRIGFSVELNASMAEFSVKFAAANKALSDQLTDEDRAYNSLFKYVTLRLVKAPKM